jgi:hypothetical protein
MHVCAKHTGVSQHCPLRVPRRNELIQCPGLDSSQSPNTEPGVWRNGDSRAGVRDVSWSAGK